MQAFISKSQNAIESLIKSMESHGHVTNFPSELAKALFKDESLPTLPFSRILTTDQLKRLLSLENEDGIIFSTLLSTNASICHLLSQITEFLDLNEIYFPLMTPNCFGYFLHPFKGLKPSQLRLVSLLPGNVLETVKASQSQLISKEKVSFDSCSLLMYLNTNLRMSYRMRLNIFEYSASILSKMNSLGQFYSTGIVNLKAKYLIQQFPEIFKDVDYKGFYFTITNFSNDFPASWIWDNESFLVWDLLGMFYTALNDQRIQISSNVILAFLNIRNLSDFCIQIQFEMQEKNKHLNMKLAKWEITRREILDDPDYFKEEIFEASSKFFYKLSILKNIIQIYLEKESIKKDSSENARKNYEKLLKFIENIWNLYEEIYRKITGMKGFLEISKEFADKEIGVIEAKMTKRSKKSAKEIANLDIQKLIKALRKRKNIFKSFYKAVFGLQIYKGNPSGSLFWNVKAWNGEFLKIGALQRQVMQELIKQSAGTIDISDVSIKAENLAQQMVLEEYSLTESKESEDVIYALLEKNLFKLKEELKKARLKLSQLLDKSHKTSWTPSDAELENFQEFSYKVRKIFNQISFIRSYLPDLLENSEGFLVDSAWNYRINLFIDLADEIFYSNHTEWNRLSLNLRKMDIIMAVPISENSMENGEQGEASLNYEDNIEDFLEEKSHSRLLNSDSLAGLSSIDHRSEEIFQYSGGVKVKSNRQNEERTDTKEFDSIEDYSTLNARQIAELPLKFWKNLPLKATFGATRMHINEFKIFLLQKIKGKENKEIQEIISNLNLDQFHPSFLNEFDSEFISEIAGFIKKDTWKFLNSRQISNSVVKDISSFIEIFNSDTKFASNICAQFPDWQHVEEHFSPKKQLNFHLDCLENLTSHFEGHKLSDFISVSDGIVQFHMMPEKFNLLSWTKETLSKIPSSWFNEENDSLMAHFIKGVARDLLPKDISIGDLTLAALGEYKIKDFGDISSDELQNMTAEDWRNLPDWATDLDDPKGRFIDYKKFKQILLESIKSKSESDSSQNFIKNLDISRFSTRFLEQFDKEILEILKEKFSPIQWASFDANEILQIESLEGVPNFFIAFNDEKHKLAEKLAKNLADYESWKTLEKPPINMQFLLHLQDPFGKVPVRKAFPLVDGKYRFGCIFPSEFDQDSWTADLVGKIPKEYFVEGKKELKFALSKVDPQWLPEEFVFNSQDEVGNIEKDEIVSIEHLFSISKEKLSRLASEYFHLDSSSKIEPKLLSEALESRFLDPKGSQKTLGQLLAMKIDMTKMDLAYFQTLSVGALKVLAPKILKDQWDLVPEELFAVIPSLKFPEFRKYFEDKVENAQRICSKMTNEAALFDFIGKVKVPIECLPSFTQNPFQNLTVDQSFNLDAASHLLNTKNPTKSPPFPSGFFLTKEDNFKLPLFVIQLFPSTFMENSDLMFSLIPSNESCENVASTLHNFYSKMGPWLKENGYRLSITTYGLDSTIDLVVADFKLMDELDNSEAMKLLEATRFCQKISTSSLSLGFIKHIKKDCFQQIASNKQWPNDFDRFMELNDEIWSLFTADKVTLISDAVWRMFSTENFFRFHHLSPDKRTLEDSEFQRHPCAVFITEKFKKKLKDDTAKEINRICSELTHTDLNNAVQVKMNRFVYAIASVLFAIFIFIV